VVRQRKNKEGVKSVKRCEQMKKEEEVQSSIVTGKVKLHNPNFSLLYSVKHTDFGYSILLKLFNEIEQKPVSRMSGIILNDKEVELLIDVLQSLKSKVKTNVSN
jgi:hypothetical protein